MFDIATHRECKTHIVVWDGEEMLKN
jgi:hypothetical protein